MNLLEFKGYQHETMEREHQKVVKIWIGIKAHFSVYRGV